MGAAKDFKKAYRLLRKALRSRKAVQRVRRTIDSRPPHPEQHYKIAVYFADGAVNMYQMRQWYRPLAELQKLWPVVVLARNAGGAEKLIEEDAPPVAFVPTVRDLERFIATQDIRVVLYVNQNTRNFQMFRYGRRWHVFINHGESDKMYMTTNQFKAYDYAFVAGQAALDRLSSKLWAYDVAAKAIPIGRPQADHFAGEAPYPADERRVVLYAPTWEGDRPAAAYGSIASHGEAIADAVLASPAHRLVYRPHPRSGVIDREYRAANQRIIAAIAAANAADPSAHHVFDDGPHLGWQLAGADVAITDISAMVYDRLAVGKPILVTRPASPDAEVDEQGYLGAAEWLRAADAPRVLAEVDRVLNDESARSALAFWSNHHFGDTAPGAATERFHAAVERLVAEWHRFAAEHADDPRTSESDPFDEEDDEAMPASGD